MNKQRYCSRCFCELNCPCCQPAALSPEQAVASILSTIARIKGKPSNAVAAVLSETERMCRALRLPDEIESPPH